VVFNILCGNTDDHARNHACFWDGQRLALTPAFDICPQHRAGNMAGQAMLIAGDKRQSNLAVCIEAAPHFHLDQQAAEDVVERQIDAIHTHWDGACEAAELGEVDRKLLGGRMFLNRSIFENAPQGLTKLPPFLQEGGLRGMRAKRGPPTRLTARIPRSLRSPPPSQAKGAMHSRRPSLRKRLLTKLPHSCKKGD